MADRLEELQSAVRDLTAGPAPPRGARAAARGSRGDAGRGRGGRSRRRGGGARRDRDAPGHGGAGRSHAPRAGRGLRRQGPHRLPGRARRRRRGARPRLRRLLAAAGRSGSARRAARERGFPRDGEQPGRVSRSSGRRPRASGCSGRGRPAWPWSASSRSASPWHGASGMTLGAWFTTGLTLATAVALLIATRDLVAVFAALLAVAAGLEWLAYRERWLALRWGAALVLDAVALLLAALVARPQGLPEGYVPLAPPVAAGALLALPALYVVSLAARTLRLERPVTLVRGGPGDARHPPGLRRGLAGAPRPRRLDHGPRRPRPPARRAVLRGGLRLRRATRGPGAQLLLLRDRGRAPRAGRGERRRLRPGPAVRARRPGARRRGVRAALRPDDPARAQRLLPGGRRARDRPSSSPAPARSRDGRRGTFLRSCGSRRWRRPPGGRSSRPTPRPRARARPACPSCCSRPSPCSRWARPCRQACGRRSVSGSPATPVSAPSCARPSSPPSPSPSPPVPGGGHGRSWAGWWYPLVALGGVKLLFQDLRDGRPATLVASLALYGAVLVLAPRLMKPAPGRAG